MGSSEGNGACSAPHQAPGASTPRLCLDVVLWALCLAGAAWGLRASAQLVRTLPGQWPSPKVVTVVTSCAALVVSLLAGLLELRRARRGASRAGAAALTRKALAATVLAWLWTVLVHPDLFWGPFLPLSAASASLLLGSAVAASHLPLALLPPAPRRAFDLLLFSVCIAAVAGEAGLRTLSRLAPSPLLARQDASPGQRLQYYRLQPGRLRLGLRVNSAGCFDEEFGPRRPDRRRVVVIGDSFSIGCVPHPFHYTTVAEEALGDTELCNLGIASIGPTQYLQLLRDEAHDLEPDVVVISLFAGNDLQVDPVTVRAEGRWLRLLLDRRNVLLYLVPTRLRQIARERARTGRAGVMVGSVQGDDLRIPEGASAQEMVQLMPWLEEPELERPTWSAGHYRSMEASRIRLACTDGSDAYAALFGVLEQVIAQAGDTRLAFVLIPDEFQVEDEVWREALAAAGDGPFERDLFQRKVGAWLGDRGIPTLDLLPLLRAAPPRPDGRLHLYVLRDSHFNARGNRVAGLALAQFLRPLLGASPAPR